MLVEMKGWTWLFFLFLTMAANAPAGQLVSTGVGVVRGQVLTSREVQIQNFIEVALYGKMSGDSPKILALDSKAFAKTVNEALIEAAVSLEAKNFNLAQLSEEEIASAQKKIQRLFKNNSDWRQLQVSASELDSHVRRKLQAKKFIQFRAQSSVLPITDAEAQKYFNENRLKFGNLPFENFKENIKSFLGRAQVERRLKDWYDLLLNKYQVKNLIAEM